MQTIENTKKRSKGFTLVELIIVIMILSVLAIIAIMSFRGYTSNARDSVRMSTSQTMYQGLEVFYTKTGRYPLPDGALTLSGLSIQGSIGSDISRKIQLSGKITDPKDDTKEYIYTVTMSQTKAQVGIFLENGGEKEVGMISKTYAQSNLCDSIFNYGNIVGIVVDDASQKPIHLVHTGSYDIASQGEYEVCFRNSGSGKSLSGSGEGLKLEVAMVQNSCILGSKSVKSGGIIPAYKTSQVPFGQTCESISISRTCENGILKGDTQYKYDSCGVSSASNCSASSYSGYTIPAINHAGSGIGTLRIGNGDKTIQVTCDNGTFNYGIEGIVCDEDYIQTASGTCILGTCNGTFPDHAVLNGTQGTKTRGYSGTSGICKFQCDTNFTWNASTSQCVANTQGVACIGLPTNASWNTASSITQTWSGGLWYPSATGSYNTQASTSECRYNCNAGYSHSGTTCTPLQQTVTQAIFNSRTFSFTGFTLLYGTPQTKASKVLTITGGTSMLTTTFSLETDGTTITPSAQSEAITCSAGYYLSTTVCTPQWSGTATTGYQYANTSGVPQYPTSCSDLLAQSTWKNLLVGSPRNGSKFADGVYWIKPGATAFKAYCDMTSEGGGWTMVVAQYEADPVTSWDEGIQADYDPSLVTMKGFALNTSQIPTHNQVAFGKDKTATFVDYANAIYRTGDIDVTLLKGKKTPTTFYQMHRNIGYHYTRHNPEVQGQDMREEWRNSLTFDKIGGIAYTWAFSTKHPSSTNRGYAMDGSNLETTSESYAWTVWVRQATGTFLVGDNGGFHWNNGTYGASCKHYLDNSGNEGDGYYWLNPDGGTPFRAYCDMTNGGRTLTHILRYVNLNTSYSTSQSYAGYHVTTADQMWNNSYISDDAYVAPLKRFGSYTSWVWLTDATRSNITAVTNTATYKSNGRKQDMDNYMSYWYNGNSSSARPDYIVYSGNISGGTTNTITTGSCTVGEGMIKGWWHSNSIGVEIFIASNNYSSACQRQQPASVPFQYSFIGGGFPGMNVSGMVTNTPNQDTTKRHSLWIK